MITISLNTLFIVELTRLGQELYLSYLNRISGYSKGSKEYEEYSLAKGEELYYNPHIQMELWKLMKIFGPHMYNGPEQIFKSNILEKN